MEEQSKIDLLGFSNEFELPFSNTTKSVLNFLFTKLKGNQVSSEALLFSLIRTRGLKSDQIDHPVLVEFRNWLGPLFNGERGATFVNDIFEQTKVVEFNDNDFTVNAKKFQIEEDAKAIFYKAQSVAQLFDDTKKIDPHHIAVGLLKESNSKAHALLKKLGADFASLDQAILSALKGINLAVYKSYGSLLSAVNKKVEGNTDEDPESNRGDGKKKLKEKTTEIGAGYKVDREASPEEECLNIDKYVHVLSRFFRSANGEFCFGLFGHWGRGKTYLMEQVAKNLEKQRYETVFFNAWKYRTTPETWVYLYETFAEKVSAKSFWSRFWIILRTGVEKTGHLPLVVGIVLLGSQLLPVPEKLKLFEALVRIFGIGGLFLIARYFFALKGFFSSDAKRYFSLNRHGEKLGLQALIGNDLKALIKAWIPDSKNEESETSKILLIIDDLDRCNPEQMLEIIESLKLLLEDPDIHKRVQTVVLVEEEMLYEAIKKKFASHFFDEQKFQSNSSENKNGKDFGEKDVGIKETENPSRVKILNEHMQKLFISYLRLPPLSGEEALEVVNKVFEKDAKEAEQTPISNQKQKELEEPNTKFPKQRTDKTGATKKLEADTSGKGTSKSGPKSSEGEKKGDSGSVFGDDEKENICELIPELIKARGLHWGPRALRIFLFKYQLCRILCLQFEPNLDLVKLPTTLIDGINEKDRRLLASFNGSLSQEEIKPPATLLENLVRQVS